MSTVISLPVPIELRDRYRALAKGNASAAAELMRNALATYVDGKDVSAYLKLSPDDLALARRVFRGDIGEGMGVLLRFYAAALERQP